MFFLNSRLICFLLLCFFFFTSDGNWETISWSGSRRRCELSLVFSNLLSGPHVACGVGRLTGWHRARRWQREPWVPVGDGGGAGARSPRWCGRGGRGWGEEEDGAAGVSPGRWRLRRHRDVAAEATQDIWIAADNEASYMLTGYQPGNLLFSSSSRDKRLVTETKRWFNQPQNQPLCFFFLLSVVNEGLLQINAGSVISRQAFLSFYGQNRKYFVSKFL